MSEQRDRKFLLTTFGLGHLANDWAPGAVWLLAPAIALDMGLSPTQIGLLITIHLLGSGLVYLPAGMLADRVSNRGRLLLGTFWWVAIGYFLASFSPNYGMLVIALAVAGMGDAMWHPIATGVLVQRMPERRGQALGVHAMGGTLAEVLAPLAVGFLLVFFDWRIVLQLSVLPALVMGIVFIRIARRVPPSPDTAMTLADIRGLVNVWRQPVGLGLIAIVIIYSMGLMALMSMTPLFLQSAHGYSSALSGAAFALMLLTGSLAQPFVGRLSDVAGRKPVFLVGSALAIAASLAVAVLHGVLLIVALVTAIAALVAVRSGLLALTVEYASRREATTLGFVFGVMDGVGAFGALLAGIAAEADLRYAFVLAALFTTISLALTLIVPFRTSAPAAERVPAG